MKGAGILIIVIAMSLAGNSMALRLKKRLRSLEALITLIESLEVRIREFNSPVKEFFKNCSPPKELIGLCNSAYSEGLYNSVKSHAEELALDAADTELLCELAEALGTYSAYEEEKRCRYYRERLEVTRAELAEKLPVKAGLLRSAGLMCGILVAVTVI